MEIETFNINVRILQLDILSELEIIAVEATYEIRLGGILISIIEYIPERPDHWYQIKGRLPKGDVKVVGEAIKSYK